MSERSKQRNVSVVKGINFNTEKNPENAHTDVKCVSESITARTGPRSCARFCSFLMITFIYIHYLRKYNMGYPSVGD